MSLLKYKNVVSSSPLAIDLCGELIDRIGERTLQHKDNGRLLMRSIRG